MEVNPLSIILVKSDSKGDRLLFRYPYEADLANDINDQRNGMRNPYALSVIEDLLQTPMPQTSNIHKGQLTGFMDEVLSTLFAVKPELCNRKFELKVNDVRFVGHPTLLPFRANKEDGTSSPMILINIVFALQALASHSVVKCYYDLSKRLGKALRYEEKRCAFLSDEMKIMIAIHDELSSMDSDNEDNLDSSENCSPMDDPCRSPFHNILQKSSLANSLKTVFDELSSTGIVQVRINDWTLVSFCLPHKAHQFHNRGLIIEPETIDRCLRSLRPYHGLLLLIDPNELLNSIPFDSNPSLIRLITQNNPLKSLQTLAIDTDLPLQQIFQLTGHLVYWAKATIIYPLCESNVYVIAPDAQVHLHSALVEKFAEDFPGLCLIQLMSMLSLPAPLWYPARTWAGGPALFAKCVVWMLQRHLLLQLHTYIQFLPTVHGPPRNGTRDYYCEKHNGQRQALSDSMNSLNHIPHTSATTPSSENSGDESLVLCGVDNYEWMFPANIFKITEMDYPPKKHDKTEIVKMNGKVNESDKNRIDNPKNVFRENSLIFGDITLGSSADSQSTMTASSEHDSSIDNVDDMILKFNNNEHEKLHSNGIKFVNGNKNLLNDKIVNDVELTNIVSNNNLKNIIYNVNGGTDSILNNENDAKVVLNGLNNLKIEDNVVVNGKDTNEKERYHLTLNTSNSSSGSNLSEKKFNNVNFKHLDTSHQLNNTANVPHYNMCDVVDGSNKNSSASINNSNGEPFNEETLLAEFTEEEKVALFKIPAAHKPEDLHLMATLYKKGYFKGEQHIEEIMYMENLTRSQVLQLLDKFRDVLITYETEDPAIAMLYSNM